MRVVHENEAAIKRLRNVTQRVLRHKSRGNVLTRD